MGVDFMGDFKNDGLFLFVVAVDYDRIQGTYLGKFLRPILISDIAHMDILSESALQKLGLDQYIGYSFESSLKQNDPESLTTLNSELNVYGLNLSKIADYNHSFTFLFEHVIEQMPALSVSPGHALASLMQGSNPLLSRRKAQNHAERLHGLLSNPNFVSHWGGFKGPSYDASLILFSVDTRISENILEANVTNNFIFQGSYNIFNVIGEHFHEYYHGSGSFGDAVAVLAAFKDVDHQSLGYSPSDMSIFFNKINDVDKAYAKFVKYLDDHFNALHFIALSNSAKRNASFYKTKPAAPIDLNKLIEDAYSSGRGRTLASFTFKYDIPRFFEEDPAVDSVWFEKDTGASFFVYKLDSPVINRLNSAVRPK